MGIELLTLLPLLDLVVEDVSASDIMPGSSSGNKAEGALFLLPLLLDMPPYPFTLFKEVLCRLPLELDELEDE